MHFLEVLFRIANHREIVEEKLLKRVWMIGMEVALRLQAVELLCPDLRRGVLQGLILQILLQLKNDIFHYRFLKLDHNLYSYRHIRILIDMPFICYVSRSPTVSWCEK